MQLSKMLKQLNKSKIVMLIVMLMIVTSGCAQKVTYEISNDGMCLIFDPIHGSYKDTEKTKEQLEKYMDLYTYFCKEGGTNGSR
ncbi:hypothetical protein [Wohlfahrtiimonas larvae]|uniref:hypothetical protein n=1 Tax=Wohlfahrtiimonas larvae TaxID=1157986 RepID=UPI00098D552A|nr:hypothetical protein [Wohlfahrtiimonas larvae]